MQVFEARVAASLDDGLSNTNPNFNATGSNIALGQDASYIYNVFARFLNVTIPPGATITVAYVVMTARFSGSDGSQKTNLYFEDADDAVAPTSRVEHEADVRTTAFTVWDDVDYTIDLETNSPSIVDVIQEIVDRGSWASGNAMMLLWDDDGSAVGDFCQPWAYDGDAAKAILLHVEYTT